MNVNASEQDIFRATTGLAIYASLARTLAYCLYWSQHATRWDGDVPVIWKTGSELHTALRIAARTANRHFKELAALGYWEISYRPRPGTIGKVTWLTMTARALDLVALARQQAVSRSPKKSRKGTPGGTIESPPDATVTADPSAYDVTSKQVHQSAKTAKNGKGFILPSEAGKKGMNEACPSGYSGEDGKGMPKAPGYVKACPRIMHLQLSCATSGLLRAFKNGIGRANLHGSTLPRSERRQARPGLPKSTWLTSYVRWSTIGAGSAGAWPCATPITQRTSTLPVRWPWHMSSTPSDRKCWIR